MCIQIEEGRLWFQSNCDNSLDVLGISGLPINDGAWHAVALDLTYNYTMLSLDDSYVERWHDNQVPVHLWPSGTNGSLFFGAQVPQRGGHRQSRPYDGFQGCLSAVTLNGNELPLQSKRNHHGELTATSEVKIGCMLYPNPCLGVSCQNGASCNSLPSGGKMCRKVCHCIALKGFDLQDLFCIFHSSGLKHRHILCALRTDKKYFGE